MISAAEALKDFEKIKASNIPEVEPFSRGHRACQGCGEVLALRLAAKAIGNNFIAVSATGCMEIISSPYPQTAWNVPWIHVTGALVYSCPAYFQIWSAMASRM